MARSSCSEVYYKKGVLKSFAKFPGKRVRRSLFLNKAAALRPATLSKKRLRHRCYPVNLMKFLRTPFFTEHFRWLLLHGHEFKLLGFLVFWTRWRYFKISWQSGSKQLTKDLVLLWFQGFIHRTWNLKKKILLKLILSDAKRPRTSTTSLRYFF